MSVHWLLCSYYVVEDAVKTMKTWKGVCRVPLRTRVEALVFESIHSSWAGLGFIFSKEFTLHMSVFKTTKKDVYRERHVYRQGLPVPCGVCLLGVSSSPGHIHPPQSERTCFSFWALNVDVKCDSYQGEKWMRILGWQTLSLDDTYLHSSLYLQEISADSHTPLL